MGIFYRNPNLTNLLLDDYFREVIERCQASWRRVIAKAVEAGVPAPAFTTALAFYDGYRSQRLPANLLQAQRDYFGAHTYERLDRPTAGKRPRSRSCDPLAGLDVVLGVIEHAV